MATLEEKQETVDVLKGERHYRIHLTGYGGDTNGKGYSAHLWKNV